MKLSRCFHLLRILRLIFTSLVFSSVMSQAVETEGLLNKLLAPGPLIKGHKDLEKKDCLKCHEAGKGIADSKCLSCHKEIKPFVDGQRGFHGLAVKKQNCFQCHTDHKGRDHDTTLIDTKGFNHLALTGYSLEGQHAKIRCNECHVEKRVSKPIRSQDIRFLSAKTISCKGCHQKDDVHFYSGEMAKKDCNSCHGNQSWKANIKFDHQTETKFKLVERHAELNCKDCHLTDKRFEKRRESYRYQWPQLAQNQCLSCHAPVHKDKMSPKFANGNCTTCHNQTKWSIPQFDHGVTGFKLLGKHSDARCVDCHKPASKAKANALPLSSTPLKNLNFMGLKQQCLSCHRDYHQFENSFIKKLKNPNQCLNCHEEKSWRQTHWFNHNQQTRLAIDGKHSELSCKECHLPNTMNSLRKDDKAAATKLAPAKSNSSIPLKRVTYHWDQLESKTCETCHSNPHLQEFSKELLSKKCTSCHTTEGWFTQKAGTGFDHNQSRFPLTGSHTKVRCIDCHGEVGKQKFKFKSVDQKFCVDCHNNIHAQQFKGNWNTTNCTQCHSTDKFSTLQNFDHQLTGFALKDKHASVQCSECHRPLPNNYSLLWPNVNSKIRTEAVMKPMSNFQFPLLKTQSCRQCHADFHKGQFDNSCSDCHTEKSWKAVNFDHNRQSQFSLKGKHQELRCDQCHQPASQKVMFNHQQYPWTQFKPTSSQCVDCHKDPHKGNFGRTCQECHNERGWSSTKDFHKNFTLSGVHYTSECSECHKDGKKLAGLSQQCIACHQKDDIHNGATPNCRDCHTQQFWEVTSFRHSLTRFPLRGAHRVAECTECHSTGIYKGLSTSCVSCHLSDFTANPAPHTSGDTNCVSCHRNTFTFGDGK